MLYDMDLETSIASQNLDDFTGLSPDDTCHDSIDFLIPDVRMLDEFCRRSVLVINDISGCCDVCTHSEHYAPVFSASTSRRSVVIDNVSGKGKVLPQRASIRLVEQRLPRVSFESGKPQKRSRDANSYATDESSVLLSNKKLKIYSHEAESLDLVKTHKLESLIEDQIEAFLENRYSSISQTSYKISGEYNKSTDRACWKEQELLLRTRHPYASLLSSKTLSWSSLANNHLAIANLPSNLQHTSKGSETGSVIVFDLPGTADHGPCLETGDYQADNDPGYFEESDLESMPEEHASAITSTSSILGYPGRFSMLHSQSSLYPSVQPTNYSFGLTYHPNGRIINRAFVRDPRYQITSSYEVDIVQDTALSAAISHAELTAAKLEPLKQMRSSSERALRREIHRECALARLEGVPVGYLRYFAGHMTVEEYLAARICVCWSDCFCNKLCTRYGDLLCPCSENLELCD